ncbi:aldehyde dehydrogenase family protein [Bosea sp. (in: a-proteobacteria)]|uniref:aldehyde dehydrogenase family protein n=1 Tax=Bosea sp. (in: a-proteobacteria) TaxID=1871050 RepID=UPI00261DD23F|nr:aldehyde dehydrogenase family protein [Bosea sp. (in: a-proteobacteria)]MCO5090735.1 aldehyde dehydrogenase family protein [Bosea sp. (in: a-proteobacteria)]
MGCVLHRRPNPFASARATPEIPRSPSSSRSPIRRRIRAYRPLSGASVVFNIFVDIIAAIFEEGCQRGHLQVVRTVERLPFGLAACAFSRSGRNIDILAEGIEVGMLSVNHLGLAPAEMPFGGVEDSGRGSAGGSEADLGREPVTHTPAG